MTNKTFYGWKLVNGSKQWLSDLAPHSVEFTPDVNAAIKLTQRQIAALGGKGYMVRFVETKNASEYLSASQVAAL